MSVLGSAGRSPPQPASVGEGPRARANDGGEAVQVDEAPPQQPASLALADPSVHMGEHDAPEEDIPGGPESSDESSVDAEVAGNGYGDDAADINAGFKEEFFSMMQHMSDVVFSRVIMF